MLFVIVDVSTPRLDDSVAVFGWYTLSPKNRFDQCECVFDSKSLGRSIASGAVLYPYRSIRAGAEKQMSGLATTSNLFSLRIAENIEWFRVHAIPWVVRKNIVFQSRKSFRRPNLNGVIGSIDHAIFHWKSRPIGSSHFSIVMIKNRRRRHMMMMTGIA